MQTFNGQRARDCRDIEKEEGCEICKMHVKLKKFERKRSAGKLRLRRNYNVASYKMSAGSTTSGALDLFSYILNV